MSEATNHKFGKFLGNRLSPEERREALENLFVFGRENQRPFLIRMTVLLLVSTVIASCGLLSDSAAVVIGAMLVAPLMRPVMAAAAAISLGWSKRLYNSLILICCMAVAAVLIAICITYIAPHMITIPVQVLARTKPTFFDLVIALAAGAGGAYVITRKEASSIPGVAISVALLPPLASCGILVVFGENELALKAFILFFTNFAAMVMAGVLTFMSVGISPESTRKRSAKLIRNSLVLFTILVVTTQCLFIFTVPRSGMTQHIKPTSQKYCRPGWRRMNWLSIALNSIMKSELCICSCWAQIRRLISAPRSEEHTSELQSR